MLTRTARRYQGIAALCAQQHGVHVQRGGAAEDGADIGGVHDVFQHCHPPRSGADLLHRGQLGTAHGAQHAPRQLEARQLLQHLQRRGVHRNIRRTPGQQLRRLALHVLALHQEGHRHTACIQRPADHQRAFRDEQGVGPGRPVYQLVLRQPGVDVQLRGVKIRDLAQIHGRILLLSSAAGRQSRRPYGIFISHERSAPSHRDGSNGRRGRTPCGL